MYTTRGGQPHRVEKDASAFDKFHLAIKSKHSDYMGHKVNFWGYFGSS